MIFVWNFLNNKVRVCFSTPCYAIRVICEHCDNIRQEEKEDAAGVIFRERERDCAEISSEEFKIYNFLILESHFFEMKKDLVCFFSKNIFCSLKSRSWVFFISVTIE